jgi:Zn-dependent peptidase ImmA (M78 family)
LADKIKKDIAVIDAWCDAKSNVLPTMKQAEEIAEILHIPFLSLYLKPEQISDDFLENGTRYSKRTLSITADDDSLINIAINDLRMARNLYKILAEETDTKVPPFNIFFNSSLSVKEFAKAIKTAFEIGETDNFKFPSPRQFYLYLRKKIEQKSIFVNGFFKVDVNILRGIALYDPNLPIIGINAKDSSRAKLFTLIHELTHILQKNSAVCNDFFNSNLNEEVFCNAVAGEFLVPSESLLTNLEPIKKLELEPKIKLLSKKFNVSQEVIARRLLNLKIIGSTCFHFYR